MASPQPPTVPARRQLRRHLGAATLCAALVAGGTTVAVADPAPVPTPVAATATSAKPVAAKAKSRPAPVAPRRARSGWRDVLSNVTPVRMPRTSPGPGGPGGPGPSPAPTPSPTPAPGPHGRVPLGFSPGFSIMEESLADLRRDLDHMRTLGITRVRLDLSWARVEGSRGYYDWSQPDRVFNEAHRRGIDVLAVIGYQPDWAQRYDAAGRPRPVDQAGFARFAEAAAVRYRTQVGAWEIWNEPNLQRFWVAAPNAAQYADLVNAVAPRLRAGDPGAPVLVGSMSPANDYAGSTLSPMTFLRGIYDRVPLGNFDAVSVHPYSYPAMPTGSEEWNTFFRMNQLRTIMAANGDAGTKIWLTEFGAPTGSSSESVSEQVQATMLVAGIREARRRDYAGPLYLYSLRDAGTNAGDREDNFGLLTHGWRAKPAYGALRQEILRTRP